MNFFKSIFLTIFLFFFSTHLFAQEVKMKGVDLSSLLSPEGFSPTINLLLSMSFLSLIPFFLISATAFLRVVIILSMTRQALATQQSPPNSVIIALAIFITMFIMMPTWNIVTESAVKPYREGKITQRRAYELALRPFRDFMLKYTSEKDLALFLEFSGVGYAQRHEDVPLYVLIPSYIISELKVAFQIGFILFIPFVVIDLIISNILLSLGMFMLSPSMISLPFKILLFVLVDGWNLIIRGILISLS